MLSPLRLKKFMSQLLANTTEIIPQPLLLSIIGASVMIKGIALYVAVPTILRCIQKKTQKVQSQIRIYL